MNWKTCKHQSRLSPRSKGIALTSLSVMLLLHGCASEPQVITRTEVIENRVEVLLPIERSRLPACDPIPVPRADLKWKELPAVWAQAVQALEACNGRIGDFWHWYDAQTVNQPEKKLQPR